MHAPPEPGQQLTLDAEGNITTLAPPPPEVPEQLAPQLLDHETQSPAPHQPEAEMV